MRTYVRIMTPAQLEQITQQLARQLYHDAGRGTAITVPWDSPRLPGTTRRGWEAQASASVQALDRLGLLREP
jgi:hypothetical protein